LPAAWLSAVWVLLPAAAALLSAPDWAEVPAAFWSAAFWPAAEALWLELSFPLTALLLVAGGLFSAAAPLDGVELLEALLL
jgi:hypothetical protein